MIASSQKYQSLGGKDTILKTQLLALRFVAIPQVQATLRLILSTLVPIEKNEIPRWARDKRHTDNYSIFKAAFQEVREAQ